MAVSSTTILNDADGRKNERNPRIENKSKLDTMGLMSVENTDAFT